MLLLKSNFTICICAFVFVFVNSLVCCPVHYLSASYSEHMANGWAHLRAPDEGTCLMVHPPVDKAFQAPSVWDTPWLAVAGFKPKATVFNVVTHRLVSIDRIQYIIGTDANNQFKIPSLLAKSRKTWSLLIEERMHQFEGARQLRSRSNPLSYAHVWPHWPLWSSACSAHWSRS